MLLFAYGYLTQHALAVPTSELQHGMSRTEILSLLGAPNDKSEKAVKNEVVWEYKNLSLTFIEGRLARWSNQTTGEGGGDEKTEKLAAPSKHVTQPLTFQELFKNLPSEGGEPSADQPGYPPPPPMATTQRLTPPPTNSPFSNAPAGMSGLLERLREQSARGHADPDLP